ncbi:MAG: ATP-dependent Clp protease proteolytic subunit [Chloroflexi bacterium]|nr:ATP-dependent Clp protease proteolytic subunit [Chloroflexota bacterium]
MNAVRDEHAGQARGAVDVVRRRYLKQLFEYTGRNVIAYYSGFLSKPGILQEDINDEDKNGFMMAVHRLERKKGLDLILHTPGGNIAATQSIADYLHKMFGNDIRAIVPQIAMSAGAMLACSCRSIVMATHSNLGPIDPQLSGVPAYGVIKEFERACKEVKRDPSKAPLWHAIISQYRPTFLSQCQNAIDWSNAFVQEQLESVMFGGQKDAKTKAAAIVAKLTDYSGNKTHSRHIHYDECHDMGLVVERLEDCPQLQDLVLTVHHSYMHSLMNTPSYKMIENHLGTALVKQQVVQPVIQQVQQG